MNVLLKKMKMIKKYLTSGFSLICMRLLSSLFFSVLEVYWNRNTLILEIIQQDLLKHMRSSMHYVLLFFLCFNKANALDISS